jgi:hypothetical protein
MRAILNLTVRRRPVRPAQRRWPIHLPKFRIVAIDETRATRHHSPRGTQVAPGLASRSRLLGSLARAERFMFRLRLDRHGRQMFAGKNGKAFEFETDRCVPFQEWK